MGERLDYYFITLLDRLGVEAFSMSFVFSLTSRFFKSWLCF